MQGGWQGPSLSPGHTGGPGGPNGGMPFGHYEFNAYENAILQKTAGRARLWGWISVLLGVAQLMASCGMVARAELASQLPLGLLAAIVGFTFIGVGNSLRSVVLTRGQDLSHLMLAMQKLGSAFMIQTVCTVLAFVAAAIVLVVALFVFAASSVAAP